MPDASPSAPSERGGSGVLADVDVGAGRVVVVGIPPPDTESPTIRDDASAVGSWPAAAALATSSPVPGSTSEPDAGTCSASGTVAPPLAEAPTPPMRGVTFKMELGGASELERGVTPTWP
eukprot:3226320-Rhodomonas_salina.2